MNGPTPSPVVCPANLTRIVLTGFMGAGKTTVGRFLADRLGWRFLDSDGLVEKQAGMTVAEIFESRGEGDFREMEATSIRQALGDEHLVLALGGGALETAATRDLLASAADTLVVYLEAPLEMLIARCAGHVEGPVRPVLANRARLAERWMARLPWYRQAHLTIATGERSPEAVVESIVMELESRHPIGASSCQGHGKTGASA